MTKHGTVWACLCLPLAAGALSFGCASNDPVSRVSVRVRQSVEASYGRVMQGPYMFRTRRNPCACDPALEYEAEIFGAFRHIKVDSEIPDVGEGIREVCYGRTGRFYESAGGQLFYELNVLPDESCVR